MGWERRRNGRLYYYRKLWRNGRVVSEYVGSGPEAERIAGEMATKVKKREQERSCLYAGQFAQESLFKEFDEAVALIRDTVLLSAGYHQHKRTWRLPRD